MPPGSLVAVAGGFYVPRIMNPGIQGVKYPSSDALNARHPKPRWPRARPAEVIHVGIQRDVWDWVLFWLAVVAAAGALLGFWTWWVQQRRTPEIEFAWSTNWGEWRVKETQFVPMVTGTLDVQVVLINVGTGAARRLIINVVVPAWVDFPQPSPSWSDFQELGDGSHYRVGRSEDFYPAMDLVINLKLRVADDPQSIVAPAFMEVSVETEGLTPNGTRVLPSFAHKVGQQRAEFWNSPNWPGEKYWRWFRSVPRWVHTIPKDNVRCGPGRRVDRRAIDSD